MFVIAIVRDCRYRHVCYQSSHFLDFEFSPDGIKPQDRLTATINQLITPKLKKEIKHFFSHGRILP